MARRLAVLLAAAAAAGGLAGQTSTAQAYPNGQIPQTALSRIYDSTYRVYLSKDAAASWNTMRLCAVGWPSTQKQHVTSLLAAGPNSAYRRLGVPSDWPPPEYGTQWYFWGAHVHDGGALAAYPSTSNHGNGEAIDLKAHVMRAYVDGHGRLFGWYKTEAWSEWWHVNHHGSFSRPNPGINAVSPTLTVGSGGPCQAPFVTWVQRKLKVTPASGNFGPITKGAVERWQRSHGIRVTGVVGSDTWRSLRAVPTLDKPHSAVARSAALTHGFVAHKVTEPETGTTRPTFAQSKLASAPLHLRAISGRVADISVHNGAVCMVCLNRAGVYGVWIKLGEGADYIDRLAGINAKHARLAHLPYGFYWFLRPHDWRSGAVEAREADRVAKRNGGYGQLRPAMDLEVTNCSRACTQRYARQFVVELRRLNPRTTSSTRPLNPVSYSFFYFWRDNVGLHLGTDYWGATYGSRILVPPRFTLRRPQYVAWQFSSSASATSGGRIVYRGDMSHVPNVARIRR